MNWKNNRPIYLASKSPRRKQLLSEAGFDFDVLAIDVDETIDPDEDQFLAPQRLAVKKAKEGLSTISVPNAVVIGADSIVLLNGKVYEKPKDRDDAFSMLAHLSGKTHIVITGVAIATHDKTIAFSSQTKVTFRPLDRYEIDHYLDKFQPFDKAGSYGIQDWIGLCKVSEIEGTYANVMGLPIDLVYEGLKKILT
jgi:septum formation protein